MTAAVQFTLTPTQAMPSPVQMARAGRFLAALEAEKRRLGAKPTPEGFVALLAVFLDGEWPKEKAKAKRKTPLSSLPEDELLKELAADPAFAGKDVGLEFAKCKTWCKINRKVFSARRAVNWLNNAERTLAGGTQAALSERTASIYTEPANWCPAAIALWGTDTAIMMQERGWAHLSVDFRASILKQMKR